MKNVLERGKNVDKEEFIQSKILDSGYMNDLDTKSEYERGFIDCWNYIKNMSAIIEV